MRVKHIECLYFYKNQGGTAEYFRPFDFEGTIFVF